MLTPVRDRVVARPLPPKEAEEAHQPSLIIGASDDIKRAEVLAVGSGHLSQNGLIMPLEIKVGQVVLYKKGTGHLCWSYKTQHVILREFEILGVETSS